MSHLAMRSMPQRVRKELDNQANIIHQLEARLDTQFQDLLREKTKVSKLTELLHIFRSKLDHLRSTSSSVNNVVHVKQENQKNNEKKVDIEEDKEVVVLMSVNRRIKIEPQLPTTKDQSSQVNFMFDEISKFKEQLSLDLNSAIKSINKYKFENDLLRKELEAKQALISDIRLPGQLSKTSVEQPDAKKRRFDHDDGDEEVEMEVSVLTKRSRPFRIRESPEILELRRRLDKELDDFY